MTLVTYRKFSGWSQGEGVIYLGDLPSFYGDCRVSNTRKYIAGVKSGVTTIEISKISDDKVECLGEFAMQGMVRLCMPNYRLLNYLRSSETFST